MAKLKVAAFGVSLDGFGAGPDQSLDDPLGVGGPALMQWFFPTRTFRAMHGADDGEESVDDGFARRGFENVGAWILGRNMFGPVRGPWPDLSWQGWWGDEPPYRCPVFVLTHHARPALVLGETTFHFVTDGADSARRQALEAAGGKDVRVGGGPAVIRQYLQAGQLDELHLAAGPVLLGRGEPLFQGLDLPALGYRVVETTPAERATHVLIARG